MFRRPAALLFPALVLTLALAHPGALSAHPHVWFETRVVLQPGSSTTGGSGGLRVGFEWTFDAMFTEMILADFDENRDRRFSADETQKIEAEAFSNLRHYDYFVSLRAGDRLFAPEGVEEFSARIDENHHDGERLVYRFFLTDELPASFGVTVFDESYYSAIDYHPEVVMTEGIDARRLEVTRRPARDRVARYQVGHGIAGILGGTETAYGEEVVLRLESGSVHR
jgi:ABC-type uncharacterized transport system substrate-binding protein